MRNDLSIAERFDNHAKRYGGYFTDWLGERELRAVRKLAPTNTLVLDYGCGTGRTTIDLVKRGCLITAYDISIEMLKRAQQRAQNYGSSVEFVISDDQLVGRTWPVVTCIGVADYYPDPVPLLVCLRQYIEPDGYLIITFPNALSPIGWSYYLGSRLTIPSTPRTPNFVRRACQQAGFRITNLLFVLPSARYFGYTMVMKLVVNQDVRNI